MNKLLIFILLLTTCDSVLAQGFRPTYSVALSESKGGNLLKQCSRVVPKKIKNYWTLTKEDTEILERYLSDLTSMQATECCLFEETISDLSAYGLQYIGVVMKKKRLVYINAFRVDNEGDLDRYYNKWRTEPIVVCNGGKLYWGALFDFEKLKFVSLAFNTKGNEFQQEIWTPQYSTILDSAHGTKLLKQCSRAVPLYIADFFNLNESEIKLLERHFSNLKNLRAEKSGSIGSTIPSLEKFGCQYMGVKINGSKYIYINAFRVDNVDPDSFYKNWQTDPIIICDGGNYFWGVLFNLETFEFSQLYINGP